jgi:hypothetical protein
MQCRLCHREMAPADPIYRPVGKSPIADLSLHEKGRGAGLVVRIAISPAAFDAICATLPGPSHTTPRAGSASRATRPSPRPLRAPASTVAEAIKALEERGHPLMGPPHQAGNGRSPSISSTATAGVVRTSNAYNFRDPKAVAGTLVASKSEKQTGTANQAFFSPLPCHFLPAKGDNPARSAAVPGWERQVKV